jgi:hypothetical protein
MPSEAVVQVEVANQHWFTRTVQAEALTINIISGALTRWSRVLWPRRDSTLRTKTSFVLMFTRCGLLKPILT